jgi:hypothetical protein
LETFLFYLLYVGLCTNPPKKAFSLHHDFMS